MSKEIAKYIIKDSEGKVIFEGSLREVTKKFNVTPAAIWQFGNKGKLSRGKFAGMTCEVIVPESKDVKDDFDHEDEKGVVFIKKIVEYKFSSEVVPAMSYKVGKVTKELTVQKSGKEIKLHMKYLEKWIKELQDMYEAYGDLK